MEILVLNTIRAIRALWSDSQFKSLARLTAIAIGITIPRSLLLRVDQVIE